MASFAPAAPTHRVDQTRQDLGVKTVGQWLDGQVPGADVPGFVSAQTLLEAIHAPHRVTVVEFVGCAPKVVGLATGRLAGFYRFLLQQVIRHPIAEKITRHTVQIPGLLAKSE